MSILIWTLIISLCIHNFHSNGITNNKCRDKHVTSKKLLGDSNEIDYKYHTFWFTSSCSQDHYTSIYRICALVFSSLECVILFVILHGAINFLVVQIFLTRHMEIYQYKQLGITAWSRTFSNISLYGENLFIFSSYSSQYWKVKKRRIMTCTILPYSVI